MDPFGGNDIFSLFEDQGMAEATTTTVPAPAPSSEASKKKASRRSTTKTESSPAPAQRSKKAKTASSGKSSTAPKSDEATVKLPTPSPSAPSPSPAPSASASTAAATDASAPSALNVSYATTEGSRPVDTFAQYQEQLVVGSTKPTKPSTPGEKTCAMQTCYPPNYDPNDPANAPPPARKEPAKTYPFTLDPFQQRSVECIEKNQSVLVSAHTSAGKTVVAEYAIALSLKMGQRVIYTSPIKALSNQKFRELQEEFGDVGLMTGDVTINPTASCLVMTTEILLNMLYRGSEVVREIAWVVFDEVHYMRDRSRGVVWEATIILLPHKCRFVFLSATIPNATEFALWVAKLHSQPCSVVYTDYRPTPLQHYIFPAAGEGLYLVLDEKGQFRDQNFQRALAVLNSANAAEGAAPPEGEKKKKTGGAGSDVYKIIKMIMEKNYQPCIVFSFSKKDCETHAVAMAKLDLCDDSEKQLITQIFSNAMQALNDDDRQLPQVVNMFPLLRRGIGVHHGGLLPILKEVVEILFQEGLLKVLFSTETFSMGLNMPARTVVFTSVNKFDGVTYRTVSSGEYIQMSGRAGRRGLDDKGIVVLMLDQQLEPPTAKEMITGAADPLHSSFHLGYNMLLNLLRVDGADLEFMLARSFFQFQQQRATPQIQAAIDELVVQRDAITVPREREVSAYCALQEELWRLRHEMRVVLNDPDYAEPFCNPGRLVRISAVIRGATPTTAPTVFDLGVDPSAASTTAVVPAAAGGKGGVMPKTEDAAAKPSNPNEGRSSTVTLHGAAATALDVITRLPALAGAGIEPTRFRSGSSADFTAGMPLPVLAAALPSASTSSAAGAGGAAPTAASAAGADSDNATDGASGLAPSSDPRMTPQGQLEMDWGWGVIVNIHRKVPIPAHALFGAYKPVAPVTMQRSGPRVMPTGAVDTVIDVLLPVDPASVPNEVLAPRIERTGPAAAANVAAGRGAVIDYAALRPCPKGVVPEYVVVPVLFTAFNGLSTFRLKVQDKLEERGGRVLMGAALRQAIQRSAGEVKSDTLASLGPEPTTEKECEADAMADSRPDALPLLKPVESMKVQGKGFRALLARVSKLKRKVAAHPIHTAVDRAELVALHTNKAALTSQVDWLRAKLAEVAQDAGLRQTLHRMRRVLRTLGHVSEDGTIQTKGRVACELSTCDELVGAEMVFTGVFNELDEAQICALCSCMVFDEAHDDQPPKLPEELSGPHRRLQEIARGVGKVISESRLPLDLEKFVASFNPFMMEVLYAWVKGAKFADITKMTDAFEGTIIRVIRRLEELLRQFAAAAKSIGNTELEKKFVSSIEKLKRDIVFAASLYL